MEGLRQEAARETGRLEGLLEGARREAEAEAIKLKKVSQSLRKELESTRNKFNEEKVRLKGMKCVFFASIKPNDQPVGHTTARWPFSTKLCSSHSRARRQSLSQPTDGGGSRVCLTKCKAFFHLVNPVRQPRFSIVRNAPNVTAKKQVAWRKRLTTGGRSYKNSIKLPLREWRGSENRRLPRRER